MPELPEVEVVCRGLHKALCGEIIESVQYFRPDLRFVLPPELPLRCRGAEILSVSRRGKYILFRTSRGAIVSHLGMTGVWKEVSASGRGKHDHLCIYLRSGRRFVYSDPRRFGFVLWLEGEEDSSLFTDLGLEPLSEFFTAQALRRLLRASKSAVKIAIMDQKKIVGVGNIYACEALFRAGIRPSRPAWRLSQAECERLCLAIRQILLEAIDFGGSTISDYRNVGGKPGAYQYQHFVYDRAGEPCKLCRSPIRRSELGGRGTYWCSVCQR
ncbi:MAG: bifunctional DNA-formamidopyrimidine glycosylase/DNA-(apurinic or apyrimidinic site) lyase [Bdellovibrionaceae bacterium]|nr:bifunctional DNA-formamidopyrimidine glycosylase/DNA-(apurinic or apyrimidinic site) lyase [Pseudobdellovibrionaceae bacterium]